MTEEIDDRDPTYEELKDGYIYISNLNTRLSNQLVKYPSRIEASAADLMNEGYERGAEEAWRKAGNNGPYRRAYPKDEHPAPFGRKPFDEEPKEPKPYVVDPDRAGHLHGMTNLMLRAHGPDGQWGSYDLAELTASSAEAYLQSISKPGMINIMMRILGHDLGTPQEG